MRKTHLDHKVAALLGKPVKEVSLITEAFLHALMVALISEQKVLVDNFGLFKLWVQKGVAPDVRELKTFKGERQLVLVEKKYRISITKAARFRTLIWERFGKSPRETVMEKYAVNEDVEQETLEKKAAAGCPNCGSTPAIHGKVLVCPKCGSEPFESK